MRQARTEPRQRAFTSEMLERRRAVSKALWADPAIEAKMRTALSNPARRAKISKVAKARWADPLVREKGRLPTRGVTRPNRLCYADHRRNMDTADRSGNAISPRFDECLESGARRARQQVLSPRQVPPL